MWIRCLLYPLFSNSLSILLSASVWDITSSQEFYFGLLISLPFSFLFSSSHSRLSIRPYLCSFWFVCEVFLFFLCPRERCDCLPLSFLGKFVCRHFEYWSVDQCELMVFNGCDIFLPSAAYSCDICLYRFRLTVFYWGFRGKICIASYMCAITHGSFRRYSLIIDYVTDIIGGYS